MRWGLVPGWWKTPLNETPSTFNAHGDALDALFLLQAGMHPRLYQFRPFGAERLFSVDGALESGIAGLRVCP